MPSMTIQRVIFIILCVGYTTNSTTVEVKLYYSRPNDNTYEALVFEVEHPNYPSPSYQQIQRPAQPALPPQEYSYTQSTQSIKQPQNQHPAQPPHQNSYPQPSQSPQSNIRPQNQSPTQPQPQFIYPQSSQSIERPQNQRPAQPSQPPQQNGNPQSIARPQTQSPTQSNTQPQNQRPVNPPQSPQQNFYQQSNARPQIQSKPLLLSEASYPQLTQQSNTQRPNQRPVQSPQAPQQNFNQPLPEVRDPQFTQQPNTQRQNQRPVQSPPTSQPAFYPQSVQSIARPQNTNNGYRPELNVSNGASVNRPTNTQTSTTAAAISEGIYNLGQQILYRAIGNHGRQNFKSEVISPLSIAGVSYLLYLGAAGQTENELATLLGFNRGTNQKEIHQQFGQLLNEIVHDRETPNAKKEFPEETENRVHEISIANALFVNNNIELRRQYENVARDTYQSEVRKMDFGRQGRESKRFIDNWVSTKTHGKIPTILAEPPSGNTQMIVVSALYFKALWWEELGVLHVSKLPFYPDGESNAPIAVDTIMFTTEFLPHYQSAELNCRIIGLKYQKQLSTMYIVQPLQSNRETLRNLQAQLTAQILDELIRRMTPIYASTLTVPKFHLQNELDLKSIFQQMGVTSLFANANLAPITPSQTEYPIQSIGNVDDLEYLDVVRKSNRDGSGVSISQIHHKVDLVVNEKGTEGGAATAAYADKIFGNTIKINTPFLFVVRQDNTGFPLFYGVVIEPEQD